MINRCDKREKQRIPKFGEYHFETLFKQFLNETLQKYFTH